MTVAMKTEGISQQREFQNLLKNLSTPPPRRATSTRYYLALNVTSND